MRHSSSYPSAALQSAIRFDGRSVAPGAEKNPNHQPSEEPHPRSDSAELVPLRVGSALTHFINKHKLLPQLLDKWMLEITDSPSAPTAMKSKKRKSS